MLTYPTKRFNELGDYFKFLERNFTLAKFNPNLPIIARIDGRAFHQFCKGLEKPFSTSFMECMKETCQGLGKEYNPLLIYVQSDEITLVFTGNHMFGGTVQKYISNLASSTTAYFNQAVHRHIPHKANQLPTFDCRVFQVTSIQEAFENIVWRQIDASKNSVTLLASAYFSHTQLHSKNTQMKKEMLLEKGIDWNEYDKTNQHFTRGAFFKRTMVEKQVDFPLSDKAIAANPNIYIKEGEYYVNRTEWQEITVPRLSKIVEGTDIEKRIINHIFLEAIYETV